MEIAAFCVYFFDLFTNPSIRIEFNERTFVNNCTQNEGIRFLSFAVEFLYASHMNESTGLATDIVPPMQCSNITILCGMQLVGS